jgi:hypothetical protein
MKSIYLTQEGKQEIEAKIAELEKCSSDAERIEGFKLGRLKELNKILSLATILPVEESWKLSVVSITPYKQGLLKSLYKNGVIIQPKQ